MSNRTKEPRTILPSYVPSAADYAPATRFVLFCFLVAQILDMHVLYQAKRCELVQGRGEPQVVPVACGLWP